MTKLLWGLNQLNMSRATAGPMWWKYFDFFKGGNGFEQSGSLWCRKLKKIDLLFSKRKKAVGVKKTYPRTPYQYDTNENMWNRRCNFSFLDKYSPNILYFIEYFMTIKYNYNTNPMTVIFMKRLTKTTILWLYSFHKVIFIEIFSL